LANFNGKEHLRHRAVSLRQHGFLVVTFNCLKYLFDTLFLSRDLNIPGKSCVCISDPKEDKKLSCR